MSARAGREVVCRLWWESKAFFQDSVCGRRGVGLSVSPVSIVLSAPLLTSQLSPLRSCGVFFFPLQTPSRQLCWLLRR